MKSTKNSLAFISCLSLVYSNPPTHARRRDKNENVSFRKQRNLSQEKMLLNREGKKQSHTFGLRR